MHGSLPRTVDHRDFTAYARPDHRPAADMAETLRTLWRHRSMVAGAVVLSLLAGVALILVLPREYRAVAEMMLAPAEARMLAGPEGAGTLATDRGAIAGEIEVLTSRGLLRRVIKAESLLLDAEFNPALRPPGGVLAPLGLVAPPRAAELDLAGQRARTVDALAERLSVRALGHSRVVEIAVTSRRPDKAARLANAVAAAYLVDHLEVKQAATTSVSRRLSAKVADLRRRVEAAERAVERYRDEAGLIEGRDAGINAQQISELNSELTLARARRAEADARLRQSERLLGEDGGGGAESAAEVLNSRLIQTLQAQAADVQRRRAELSAEYGRLHPKMINVEAELADLRDKIGLEIGKIVRSLRNEAEVARAREATLRQAVETGRHRAARLKQKAVRLRQLEREAEAERALFRSFLARLKEIGVRQDLQQAEARVISRADPPASHSAPNRAVILGLALAIGLVGGVGCATLSERLDRRVRNLDQLEQATGLAPLAAMPRVPRALQGTAPSELVLDKPGCAFAEALRGLHTALLQSEPERPPRSLLLTSAEPREGKTTVALALGRVLARAGDRRVLLVEADARCPRVSRLLGWRDGVGLTQVLAGRAWLADALRADRRSGLHVLPSGIAVGAPSRLLAQPLMARLLQALAEHYDLVIVDAPPVLPVADARILAPLVDKTLLLTRWGATSEQAVALAARQLREAGAGMAGAVLNQVDPRRHKLYGSGEEAVFSRSARAYYVE